jgi:signal transduction histidine kinase
VAARRLIDRWGDWALGLALTVGIESEIAFAAPAGVAVHGGRAALGLVASLVTLPLVWRRRAPVGVLAAVVGSFAFAVVLSGAGAHAGAPLSAFLALLVAFYTVGAQLAGGRSVATLVAGLAGIAALDVAAGGVFQDSGTRPGTWLAMAVSWQVGREVSRRGIEMSMLRARASALELEREERARLAAAEERARIARELHDVVAHSVSVMVVQAQAAERVLVAEEPDARDLLASIETTGRQALTELRRLLGLLGRFEEEASLEPQPSLRHLDVLAEQMRAAGLDVDVLVEGRPAPLPQGVDLSAYRIVQEGLTNTLKHAGPARAQVIVRYTPTQLEIEVRDDGRGHGDGAAGGTGQGLVGMRERVALYGGELETGPTADDGYALRARLPIGASA